MKKKRLLTLMGSMCLILVLVVLLLPACAKEEAPAAPTLAPTPTVPTVPTNSGASRIAELEAKLSQLETENQRLLTENRELSSENQRFVTENCELSDNLAKVTSQLEGIQRKIPDILIMLTEIQKDSSEFATFLGGLPDLPPPPPGLDDISKVNDVITKATFLRTILKKLPKPPPFAPAEWYELDEMKKEFIGMTEWMERLEELPEFLNIAGDLDDLRYQEIAHLENINTTMDNIKSILGD